MLADTAPPPPGEGDEVLHCDDPIASDTQETATNHARDA